MKICSNCKETKEETSFHPSTSRGTLQSWCKKCKSRDYMNKKEANRLKRKAWYLKNKSKISEKGKQLRKDPKWNTEYSIKRRCRYYGIEIADYYAKLASNNNTCEICAAPFKSTPAIDHDHTTLEFRSLLCDQCNTALGLVKESTDILNNMLAYLKKYKK